MLIFMISSIDLIDKDRSYDMTFPPLGKRIYYMHILHMFKKESVIIS